MSTKWEEAEWIPGQKLNLSFSALFVEKSSFFLAIDPEDIIFSAQLVDLNFFCCDVIENRRFEIEKMSKMASDLTVELFLLLLYYVCKSFG